MAENKKTIQEFKKIIHGSISYEIKRGVLTITGYYSGERVIIDLEKITEEMLEEIQTTEEELEEDEWED